MVFLIPVLAICNMNGCKKQSEGQDTEKSSEQLLMGRTWKADEIRVQLSNNTTTYYKRKAAGSLYDSDSLRFTAGGTGSYFYERAEYGMTWAFTDSGKTKMKIIIDQYPVPVTLYLENIHLTASLFQYAQYSSGSGISYLASCSRIPN